MIIDRHVELFILTLNAPILVRVTEQHREFICGESLQIGDGEHLGEAFPERLRLGLSSLADDRINDCTDVLVNIVSSDGDVTASRLVMRSQQGTTREDKIPCSP